jgi:transcriptional regulator with XRE-family HTH domain
MRPVAPELGSVAPAILDDVRRRCRSFRDEAFARHLGVDRTLLAHWRSGARPMPVEVLPLLADYTRDPEAVYGDLLARAGCRLQLDDQVEDLEPLEALREVRRSIGRLLQAEASATDPDSPGGATLTREEAAELLQEAEVLAQELRSLLASLRPAAARRAG